MQVIKTESNIIKSRVSDIEDWALAQAKNLANLPFIHKWIALMPDCHQWFWMPIWWVISTKGVVIPNAVWVDIWCWMCAVKLWITGIDIEDLKKVMWKIREVVPVWFNHHQEVQDKKLMPSILIDNEWNLLDNYNVIQNEFKKALYSLWTLGGGNHFIEIQKWDDWFIWVMIHSGSRNLGKQVADYYNKLAVELNEKRFCSIPKEHELAFLHIDSEEGQSYIQEMNYCVEYALANRKLMMDRILNCFVDVIWPMEHDPMINIAHNYAQMENHYWINVMVHRKWATLARLWNIWIIPWSQWTSSYIVKWLWNKESFESCSHWAGRKMWRNEAQRNLNLEDEQKILNDQWIIHSIRNIKDLDEASGAYKDIDEVMENQKDLVKILVKLTPLAVIKW